MGKYEAKISKSNHMTSLAVAVLISFAVGMGSGYYFGEKSPVKAEKQSVKPAAASTENTKPKTDAKVKESMPTADEQAALVSSTLKPFYDINLSILDKFKTDSLNESKTTGTSQDALFKNKLIGAYQGIFAKKQLQLMTDFINKGDLSSDYFTDYFYSQENSTIVSVDNVQANGGAISAKVVVTNSFEYGGNYDIPSSQDFFGELKGSGVTSAQYAKLLRLKPSNVTMIETKSIDVTIEKVNGKWMITSFNDQIGSNEIKSATIKGKVVGFADLIKRYIR